MKHKLKLFLIGGVSLTSAVINAQSGPGANYYMADGANLWTAFGGSSVSAPEANGNEFNIAVSGDIRTTQERVSAPGNQYSLGMVATGTQYNGTWVGLFDGTTDGLKNYSIDFDSGNVLAFDRNWQNSSVLFNAGAGSGLYLGITYDGAGGLWISQWNGQLVEHRTMSGAILSSFNAGFNNLTALAMDYSTGTLWMGSQNHDGRFDQFNTSGTNIGSVFYSNMSNANTLGGEFDYNPVPEPASFAVLGLGALVLLRRRKTS